MIFIFPVGIFGGRILRNRCLFVLLLRETRTHDNNVHLRAERALMFGEDGETIHRNATHDETESRQNGRVVRSSSSRKKTAIPSSGKQITS